MTNFEKYISNASPAKKALRIGVAAALFAFLCGLALVPGFTSWVEGFGWMAWVAVIAVMGILSCVFPGLEDVEPHPYDFD